jgi:hypothetical protein
MAVRTPDLQHFCPNETPNADELVRGLSLAIYCSSSDVCVFFSQLKEATKLDLEDFDSLKSEQLDAIINGSLADFDSDDLVSDEISESAARIARGCITEQTRSGHAR